LLSHRHPAGLAAATGGNPAAQFPGHSIEGADGRRRGRNRTAAAVRRARDLERDLPVPGDPPLQVEGSGRLISLPSTGGDSSEAELWNALDEVTSCVKRPKATIPDEALDKAKCRDAVKTALAQPEP